jgi:uncharacterized repeat protein (TIGR03943 family)
VVVAVNRVLQGVVLLVTGIVIGRLGMTEAHLTYVKGTLQIPLVLSALVLLTLGILSLVRDQEDELADPEEPVGADQPAVPIPVAAVPLRPGDAITGPVALETAAGDAATGDGGGVTGDDGAGEHDHAGGHGHDHSKAPRIGMLMLVPMLVLLLVAPQPLGSYAANQGGVNRVSVPSDPLEPFPSAGATSVDTTLDEMVVRALHDPTSIEGIPTRMIGFVVNDPDIEGYRLSRFSIACCAADAAVRQVIVSGAASVMPDDTWVEVVGRFDGAVVAPEGEDDPTRIPVVQVLEQRRIEPPASPYED